ncbi:MAG: MarR family transcriptional regulator [Novosphingobium sp.]
MRKGFDKSAAELGVTRSQSGLMAVVVRHPGATQRMIAEALEMSEASAGRLIDRLCADGLLERRPKEDDRRAHAIFLTDKAQPLLEELSAIVQVYEADTFKGLSDDELQQFAALLDRIYGNVAGHPAAP